MESNELAAKEEGIRQTRAILKRMLRDEVPVGIAS